MSEYSGIVCQGLYLHMLHALKHGEAKTFFNVMAETSHCDYAGRDLSAMREKTANHMTEEIACKVLSYQCMNKSEEARMMQTFVHYRESYRAELVNSLSVLNRVYYSFKCNET